MPTPKCEISPNFAHLAPAIYSQRIVSELIIGGQRSGKSARAESLAIAWLQSDLRHRAVFMATAQAWDSEMQVRIARHQKDRAQRLPQMHTLEEPRAIAALIRQHSQPQTLIVIDCITLWLSNCMLPIEGTVPDQDSLQRMIDELLATLQTAQGPVVMVSNEIGLGVIPMGAEVRAYVDQLGRLNQALAAQVPRVCWMVAGLPVLVKNEGIHEEMR